MNEGIAELVKKRRTLEPSTGDVFFPVLLQNDVIRKWNSEDSRQEWEPLKIVNLVNEVMIRMLPGKKGVVLGSGKNTEKWRGKGWNTLDIDPEVKPDWVMDANLMEKVIFPKSQDFVYAEDITFATKGGQIGVIRGRLLNQVNRVLKEGGILIIRTVDSRTPTSSLPKQEEMGRILMEHGFNAVIELRDKKPIGTKMWQQEVIYYGKKVAEGYDKSRSANYAFRDK